MAQWDHTPSAGLATFLTLDDIIRATVSFNLSKQPTNGTTKPQLPHAQKEQPETPVLQLIKEARNKGYETICLPLTTKKWKERWEGMCLLPNPSASTSELEASQEVETIETTDGDEVIQEKQDDETKETITDVAADEIEKKKRERAEAAEQWRARPGFLVDEVTIGRLDEAEGIAIMISDWLELDAEDDGIRHDAEIVCYFFPTSGF